MSLRHILLLVIAVVAGAPNAPSAEPEAKPEVIRLAVTPAAEPVPALKYQLIPKFIHRRPGNAALDYARAALNYRPSKEFEAGVAEWLKLPPADFDRRAKEKPLTEHDQSAVLDLVKLGARCETCDFQLPLRDQMFMMILLPEAQEMRKLARLVAVEARLRLSAGKHGEAIELLQTGYAMARHIGAEPTLVTGLVGVSIAAMMDQVVFDFQQRRQAPSLYWAVTFQPQPLIDLRPGLEAEMYSFHLSFPDFAEIGTAEHSAEEWNMRLTRWVAEWHALRSTFADLDSGPIIYRAPTTADKFREQLLVRVRAEAMKATIVELLVRSGVSQSRIERMSDAERALRYSRLKFEALRDDGSRWMVLPYTEAAPGLAQAEARLRKSNEDGEELIPIAGLLLPAVASARHTYAKAERRHDVLRIIEALRLHAGRYQGKLPKSLTDVTDVPLPKLDVITGKPLDYVLDGDTVRLTLPDENSATQMPLVYEITVAK